MGREYGRDCAGPAARGAAGREAAPIRPPKAVDEARFVELCDGCGECIEICETGVLAADPAGRPRLDFHRGECTFCGLCSRACPRGAFDISGSRDWTVVARLAGTCANETGGRCRECVEGCEEGAIRLAATEGGTFLPAITEEMCTGCGACVALCPADAIAPAVLEAEALAPGTGGRRS